MKNIQMEITGDTLTITVDLSQTYGKSGSGKKIIIFNNKHRL